MRSELDDFVDRTIHRFYESGTLWIEGYLPTVTQTTLSIAGDGKFLNGMFEMFSENVVTAAGGFFFVNDAGTYTEGTTFAELGFYANGDALGNHELANIVWGLIPTSTTARGITGTVVKLGKIYIVLLIIFHLMII